MAQFDAVRTPRKALNSSSPNSGRLCCGLNDGERRRLSAPSVLIAPPRIGVTVRVVPLEIHDCPFFQFLPVADHGCFQYRDGRCRPRLSYREQGNVGFVCDTRGGHRPGIADTVVSVRPPAYPVRRPTRLPATAGDGPGRHIDDVPGPAKHSLVSGAMKLSPQARS